MLCHVWPGITPMNVWDLTWGQWLTFAAATDEWAKARAADDRKEPGA